MNGASDSNLMTRKWNIVNDHSNVNYDVGNEIIYDTEVLNSNPCNSNEAYILVEVEEDSNSSSYNKSII